MTTTPTARPAAIELDAMRTQIAAVANELPLPEALPMTDRAVRGLRAPGRMRVAIGALVIGLAITALRLLVPVGVVWLQAPVAHTVAAPGSVTAVTIADGSRHSAVYKVSARIYEPTRWQWYARRTPKPFTVLDAEASGAGAAPVASAAPGPAAAMEVPDGTMPAPDAPAADVAAMPTPAADTAATPAAPTPGSVEARLAGIPPELRDMRNQRLALLQSRSNALVAAARESGQPIDVRGSGVAFASLPVTDRRATAALRDADVIVEVNGVPADTADDVITAANAAARRGAPSIRIRVAGSATPVTVQLARRGTPEFAQFGALGFDAETVLPEVSARIPMEFTDHVGSDDQGGSAGLANALRAWISFDRSGAARRFSYPIAATGTITEGGNVGSVRFIPQKLAAVRRSGARVFFTPIDDGQSAPRPDRRVHGVTVVQVASLHDAVMWLRRHPDRTP